MGELKPCPFCGAPAELERDSDHHGEWFSLGCSNHWGRPDLTDESQWCAGGRLWYTADPESLPRAIAAWNRRALSTQDAENGLAGDLVQALGIAMGALQTIQGMEPITHEITLPTVMAQHAVDALSDIKALRSNP